VKNIVAIIAALFFSTNAFADAHHPAILLLPWTIASPGASDWIGESVQQSLKADLHNASIAHPSAAPVDDPASIARLAHNASVDFVVEGHVQVIEDQLRLTATLYDSAGHSVITAKSTGALRRLFDLEDALADQIRDGLHQATAKARPITTPIPTIQSAGPIQMAQPKVLPIGTVPESYSSAQLRDGRNRFIYQVPTYGYFGGWGYGGWGNGGFGYAGYGIGGNFPGVVDGGYSSGGTRTLAW
jgi:TolB-like protein